MLARHALLTVLSTLWSGVTPSAQDPSYFTTTEVLQELQALALAHPTIARVVDLTALPGGEVTAQGQGIHALVVSDNVLVEEDEPAIVLVAQHHARELNTAAILLGAIQRTLSGYGVDPELTAGIDGHEIYFVPTVNPDGLDYVWSTDPNWRRNRRDNGDGTFGVDLNRNYPALWSSPCGGSTVTSSEFYRGPAPASEPEVRTMRALIASLRPEIYIDLHSFGREVLTTYSPCVLFGGPVANLIVRYADDLRIPMSYGLRVPSASGEAPEDHWTESGALSFLVEVGGSFQPPFAETQLEEALVWPGLRRALTAWRPALRGHVRSIFLDAPLEASVTVAPDPFTTGETRSSRARDGRYGLWLPLGTWDVTFAAPGYSSTTRTVTVSSYDAPQTFDAELVPDMPAATLQKVGTDRIGTTTTLTYTSPGDAGRLAWIALSTATTPGIVAGPRTIPLVPDDLFFASPVMPALISSNVGMLPPSETLVASLHVPDIAALIGLQLFAGGITLQVGYPLAAKTWSAPVSIVFQP